MLSLLDANPATDGADAAMSPFATIGLAIAFGLVVSILHLLAHRERPIYSLWRTLLLIAPLIAMSTMAVGSNLAAAFTLFGTLAIVRFRAPIKNPLDNLVVATAGTLIIAALILTLLAANRFVPRENRSALKLVINGIEPLNAGWQTILERESIGHRIEACTIDQTKQSQILRLSLTGISGDRWPELLAKMLELPEITHAAGRTDED